MTLPPLPPLGFGQALGESDEQLKARVTASLPPLPALAPKSPPPEWSDPDWEIDEADPVLGDCKPCKGRGRFVNLEWRAIKLECEMCKGYRQMNLPPLPPFNPSPRCDLCGGPPTRFVQTLTGTYRLCATCEPTTPVVAMVSDKLLQASAFPSTLPTLPALDVKRLGTILVPAASVKLDGSMVSVPSLYAGAQPCRVLVADWPWLFGDKTPHKGAEDHYKVMTLEEAHTFPLPPVLDDAVLFFWRVGAGNEKGSLGEAAYAVMRSWGFTPRSEVVWRKTLPCKVCAGKGWDRIRGLPVQLHDAFAEVRVWCDECKGRGHKIAIGMGRYVRGAHEVCLIGARGKCFPEDKGIRSVFDGSRGEHSAKPDRFYEIVEKLYPAGPYTELFARRRRPGWQCFGDQLPLVGA